MLELIDYAVIWAAGVAQTVFVVLYGTVPWYRNFIGRALFYKSLTLAVFIDHALFDFYVDYAHEDAVETFIHLAVAAAIVYQCYALIRQQWTDGRWRRDEPS